MTSYEVVSSKDADDHHIIEISVNPPAKREQRVCVSKVPKSLSSARPKAYIPQFVGLGPYHHSNPNLIMSKELKLAAASRVLTDILPHHNAILVLHQSLENCISDSDIEAFYHADVSLKQDNNRRCLLAVDGLFLLCLFHRGAPAKQEVHSFITVLTGKQGLAPVNAAGVQLTMDAVISDIFMLENQIPTHFLEQILQVFSDKIQSHGGVDKYLGLKMKTFCEALCPLDIHPENLSKAPEAYDHLLDLMYHLIVPQSEPDPNPVSQSPPESEPKSDPETKPESEGEYEQDKKEEDDENSQDKSPKNSNTCCFICCNVIAYTVVIGIIMGLFIKLIFSLLFLLLRSLFRIILWALRPLYGLLVTLSGILYPLVENLYDLLRENEGRFQFLKAATPFVGQLKQTSETFVHSTNKEKDTRPPVTIPSVTELDSAGIHFQLAENGSIKSIKFDENKCRFCLPRIKVDVNSGVIMRNLVAYETIAKYEGLTFTRYIELMRAIIDIPQDVKLLVRAKIIETELSDEAVTKLFNGMSKSTRPTKTPDLDEEIKKVNAKFDSTHYMSKLVAKYLYSYWKIITAIAALVFLVLTGVQTYCSVFGCSLNKQPKDGYYGRNNYFVSPI